MAKYILTLNDEQAKIVAQACEFFARIKFGQFQEISTVCLSNGLSEEEYYIQQKLAIRHLLEARKVIYPELHGISHSYGIGKFPEADRAFDVYQVLRYALGDQREPFRFRELLPNCTKTEYRNENLSRKDDLNE